MTYSSLAECKEVLRETGTEHDNEIQIMIGDADAWIDEWLRPHETVPLTGTIPNAVKRASKYKACSLFKKLYSTSDHDLAMSDVYAEVATEFIENYVKSAYKYGQAKSG